MTTRILYAAALTAILAFTSCDKKEAADPEREHAHALYKELRSVYAAYADLWNTWQLPIPTAPARQMRAYQNLSSASNNGLNMYTADILPIWTYALPNQKTTLFGK